MHNNTDSVTHMAHHLMSMFQIGLDSIPIALMGGPHDADHEYGIRGGRAKPCRACSDFQSWMQNNNKTSQPQAKASAAKECPLDKDQLGRNTWSLLHTMAAYYPEKATAQEQKSMSNMIEGLANFYPCESCAADFRRDIQDEPPNTTGRKALSDWFCRMHNRVNRKLGKPEFDCNRVDERWLDGWKDGSCG